MAILKSKYSGSMDFSKAAAFLKELLSKWNFQKSI
jgi:hypothetical protein